MNYYVYLIASRKKAKLKTYVGYTNDLKNRILKHNVNKGAKSTKGRKWKIIYFKKYKSKSKAMSEEYILKKNKKERKHITAKFLSTNQL
ncbi:GIY-YIG nuclease family protein [Pelagibacteraceae bacterium]|nr:GIY-YIG nuclease family protein [Pelagibacteraceae bacterium]